MYVCTMYTVYEYMCVCIYICKETHYIVHQHRYTAMKWEIWHSLFPYYLVLSEIYKKSLSQIELQRISSKTHKMKHEALFSSELMTCAAPLYSIVHFCIIIWPEVFLSL